MKVCPECNTEYEDFYEFCSKDNTPLESESEAASGEIAETDETAELSQDDLTMTETIDEEAETAVFEDESAEAETVAFDAESEEPSEEETVSETPAVNAAAASGARGMGAMPKLLILLGIFLLIGGGLVFWKTKVGSHGLTVENVSKEEMELILQDMDPRMLRQLATSPEAKKELANNVKELFAIASQAEKDGIAADLNIKRELENIEYEILAASYDRAMNKDKGQMPPFGFISEDRVNQFWSATDTEPGILDKIGLGGESAASREAAFQKFIDSKLALAREGGNLPPDRQPSEEELTQAKDYFAKTRIYYAEALSKKGDANSGLPENFFRKVELQTKLQKAQFLARRYATKELAEKVKVTDEDVNKYIEEHPELGNKAEKKAKAEELLQKVKNGEDFDALAKEFSDDPGSKEKGGLYEGIAEGAFVPEFEKAVFSMQPGTIYPELVESNFGFHIIKLEKLGETKGADGQVKRSFDARHILISTMFKDPENPMARELPVKDYVKTKLEKEKEEKILADIKANNPVTVAEDFEVTVPEMPEMPEMPPGMMPPPQQQPQQLPPDAQTDAPKKAAPKQPAPQPKK